ncbi:GGDEF domain-containing protein [Legionella sp. km772]|uniref:GGDEF domain-containing protein n=1 Tax=Legionella sp. km772 TaxID=2498111 RepID=UPI000F8E4D45|nr:GGDEF domain-containing protein [Legionella sp. km772]RUR12551.1 GGDEF domain-containing protein [Legionella sp. km772]
MITAANLWLGNPASSSTLDWFYISPILATVTIGINGLLIYGSLAGLMLITLLSIHLPIFYTLSPSALSVLSHVNPLFIFFLMCTILYNLLVENKLYESLLKEQNFLLSADKQKFHYLSHHDSLTNLPNRSYFHTHLQELMDTVDPKQTAISLYFMDLDDFKKINDRYGHEVGDILLLQAGKRLQACFRDSDFIARLGGDEFTAIITHPLKDKIADVLATRIKKEFKTPFLIKNLELTCSISIGTAIYPTKAKNGDMLLKMADDLMYQNKKKKTGESLF